MKFAVNWGKESLALLSRATSNWLGHDPVQNSAIISYYTIFSLPGLLVLMVNLAGYFFGKAEMARHVSEQTGGIIGSEAAINIGNSLARATQSDGNRLASILGAAVLLFGATGVFFHLQRIFNGIWKVAPKAKVKQKLVQWARDRLLSFGLVVLVGFLLLASSLLSTALTALSAWTAANISQSTLALFKGADLIASLGVVTLLFAALFRIVPDAKVKWRDVWLGALMTALLFVLAKYLLGLFFRNADPGSTYGAAGSIVVVMAWVSYVGLILLWGAEFTHVYANRRDIIPKPTEPVPEESKDVPK